MNILLGVTGSVAAIKVPELVSILKNLGEVRVIFTDRSRTFCSSVDVKSYSDEDEWKDYKFGDEVLHIELRKWATCMVVAPLDANTLAKIANGICDNLLTCVIRAWDWEKPFFFCPAMNTQMWYNQPTKKQVEELQGRGGILVPPISKTLACGDTGMGAMAPVSRIFSEINQKVRWLFPLKNCNGIPINHHPGAFGFHRKKNHHTGIDLYTSDMEPVYAAESGTVVHIAQFTGPEVGHEWWEKTWGVMVEGDTGVINYGEVVPSPELKVGDYIERGKNIGCVKRVLFEDRWRPDIPGHSTSMLHLELYKHGTRDFADWHEPSKNPNLLDPTTYLLNAENCHFAPLTWENSEQKSVG